VAIDPSDARDHDDAIWAEPDGEGGFRALVAIADVSFYVRPGGSLDRAARERANSVYFPDRVVPMLPEVLSADVCSLRAGEDRAAMACHLKIAADGKVTDWRFTRALVRIDEVIAYEEAQRRIDDGDAAPHLLNLWEAWRALERARNDRDPLALELPERRVKLDEAGRITEIALRERLDAHRVVEDFMICANVGAAKALESKVAPIVYRIHEPPNREKLIALKDYLSTFERKLTLGQVITPSLFNRLLKDVADEAEKALIMEAVLRSQTQAYYGPRNAGHFGLALGSYAHFTSPIRRYADLLVHRALVDGFGLEQPEPKGDIPPRSGLSERDRTDLSRVSDAISAAERRAMEAERETIDRYVAAWLSARVGEVFDCRVTGVLKFGLFVTIISLGGDGLVPVSTLGNERFHFDERAKVLVGDSGKTRFAMGDLLRLRLAEANPLTGALKFEPEDHDGTGIEPRGRRMESQLKKRGNHLVGQRGRPGNIRHQGRGKKR
jgi:ribonuclease R